MQILVHTDKNVKISDGMVEHVETEVGSALSRFSDQIHRVEVHLGDESAGKAGGGHNRCVIEARPNGKQPLAVTHHADSVGEAFNGAAHKLKTLVENRYEKMRDHKGAESIRHAEVDVDETLPTDDKPV